MSFRFENRRIPKKPLLPLEERVRRPGEPTDAWIARLSAAGYRTPTPAMIKTEAQIEGCREAGRVNSLVLDAVEREIAPGMTTQEIDDIVARETRALGGIPSCLGFEGFPRSVCTSVNDVICHGIPSEQVVLREGDIVNVDCATTYGGYVGDASRLFTFGALDPEVERLARITKESVALAEAHILPCDSHLGDIGYHIDTLARKNGFSVVREIGGHGVGLEMHEDPYVCHKGLPGSGILLLPGMIFTIEPMINQKSPRFYVDDRDGWTVRTADGRCSAQVEHEILITDTGIEILSH